MPSNAIPLGQIKAQVWSLTHDQGSTITPDDVAAWANEAQMDLASRLGLSQVKLTGTTAGNTIALPPTPASQRQVLHVVSLRLGTTDDVEFVDDEVFHSWVDSGDTPPHTLGRVWAGNIELYKTPVTGTAYELRYEALPNPLALDTDISELPHHLHPRLVWFARAMAFRKLGDHTNADVFHAMYENALPSPELGRDKLIPGPLVVSFEPGPFDTDDALHH